MIGQLLRDVFTVLDGGLSTALEELGHRPTGELWTAQLTLDAPAEIVAAHRRFVDAGAEIITSSSYQASVPGYVNAGASLAEAREVLASTTDLARRSGAQVVASSIGPYGAILGDGSEYSGVYDASWAEVRMFHRTRIAVLADTGPDLFAVETIPSEAEAVIICEELARATTIPFWVSFACKDGGLTCAGDELATAIAAIDAAPGVVALGINCTDPRSVVELLRICRTHTEHPILVYSNRGGEWNPDGDQWVGAPVAEDWAQEAVRWRDGGAMLIGGCCGIGSDDIRRLAALRDSMTTSS